MSDITLVERLDRLVANERNDFREIDKEDYSIIRHLLKDIDERQAYVVRPLSSEEQLKIPHGVKVHMEQFDPVKSDHKHSLDTWEGEGGSANHNDLPAYDEDE